MWVSVHSQMRVVTRAHMTVASLLLSQSSLRYPLLSPAHRYHIAMSTSYLRSCLFFLFVSCSCVFLSLHHFAWSGMEFQQNLDECARESGGGGLMLVCGCPCVLAFARLRRISFCSEHVHRIERGLCLYQIIICYLCWWVGVGGDFCQQEVKICAFSPADNRLAPCPATSSRECLVETVDRCSQVECG